MQYELDYCCYEWKTGYITCRTHSINSIADLSIEENQSNLFIDNEIFPSYIPVKNNAIVLIVHIFSINDVKPALSLVIGGIISDPLETEKISLGIHHLN